MDGEIIVFTIPTGSNRTKSSAFVKKFYGQDSTSHAGKYRYHRKGLLDEIPHNKIGRGVIIIRTKDVATISDFLTQYSAIFAMRTVVLTEADCEMLYPDIE